ncbi:MAG: transglycosylase domain-containing protein [Christensenella sp.]
MTPKKSIGNTIKELGDKTKTAAKKLCKSASVLGQRVKRAFLVNGEQSADKSDKTKNSAADEHVKRTPVRPAKAQPVKKQNVTKRPIAAPDSQEKQAEKPSEETVIFTDDVTRQFTPDSPPKSSYKNTTPQKETTQPIPIITKKSLFKPREKKPNFALGVVLSTIKMSFVAIIVVVAIALGSLMGVANAYLGTTPELDISKIETQSENTKILTQDGTQLATYTGLENREWANLEEIPKDLQNAVIAVEDIRFRYHNGVDLRRLIGAFVSNLSENQAQGGSTITQQLVKNELLTNERSYKRKLQEAYLAIELEKTYSKDQILEAYLNAIPLGGTVYGVKAAAKDYFGKGLSELTLKEMICIASITQNPTKYSPRRATYVKTDNLPGLINRMNIFAERMYWNGDITREQYDEVLTPAEVYLAPECLEQGTDNVWKLKKDAKMVLKDGYLDIWKAEMNILEQSPVNSLYPYPHFIEYMIYDVQNFMMDKEKLEHTEANRSKVDKTLRSGGYQIYATIDTNMQQTVQNTIADWDKYPEMENKIESDGNGGTITTLEPQATAVVTDNQNGYLKAIIGSRTEPDRMKTFNRAYKGKKQVGSSEKPIAVYGPAFDIGYGLGANVPYIQQPINNWIVADDGTFGFPKFQGSLSEGPITMKEAIVNSLNIAAAQTIMNYVTIPTSVDYLHKLGVSEDSLVDPDTGYDTKTGSGLALGGSNITPIEMAGAYSTIARGGEYKQPISFTKVLDSKGNVVIDAEAERDVHEAFKPATCFMLTDALVEAVKSGTGRNARLEGMTTAGKTGTNAKNRGVFFAGYTPYYTSTLWVGNDDNNISMTASAAQQSAPLWKTYMQKIHENLTDKPIMTGEYADYGITEVTICKYSNKKPKDGCSPVTALMPSDSPFLTQECDVCEYTTTDEIKMCGESHMRFVEGKCPEISAYQYSVTTRAFAKGSPYEHWGSSSLMPTEGVTNADGTVTAGEDPTQDCTLPHTPIPTPTPPVPTPTRTPTPTPTQPVPTPPAPTPPAPTTPVPTPPAPTPPAPTPPAP